MVTEVPIPEDLRETVDKWRHDLIERVAELDDDLMNRYLEGAAISEAELRAALRKGTIERKCYPVLCGAALRNIGVQRLLDAVIDYLPNPTEVPSVEGTNPRDPSQQLSRPHDSKAPFSALVFKVVSDTHGDLTYIRIYSGTLAKGTRLLNPVNGKKENASRIFEMHAKERIPLEEVGAGNIVAVVGIKDSYTGDTLCDAENPIVLERMFFPRARDLDVDRAPDRRRQAEAVRRPGHHPA